MDNLRLLYVRREDMRRWQLTTLEIQQDIQRIFEQSSLLGWCGGGTLIGAVRENGFLYWDNDLDMFFCHSDYRKILIAFHKHKFFEKYDLYYNVNGYWERHEKIMAIMSQVELNEGALDLEMVTLSKTMFKVFAKKGVPLCFYQTNNGNEEEYVSVKHFINNHITKYRITHRNDDVEFEKTYYALPDVCMLPMVRLSYLKYFLSNILFLPFRLVSISSTVLDNYISKLVTAHDSGGLSTRVPETEARKIFDRAPYDPLSVRIKLAVRNLCRSFSDFIKKGLKFKKGRTFDYIAYRQGFFRFLVMPYPVEDIFPLQKIPFENKQISVPANIHNVLSTQFGDYMRVPSIEKRLALPFFLEERMDS